MNDEVNERVQHDSASPNSDEGCEPYDLSINFDYNITRLTNENFSQIKCNDPKIEALWIHLNEELDINWEHESDCFSANNNLKLIEISSNLDDDDVNETTKEVARELFRAVARNRSIKRLRLNELPVKISREMFTILSSFFEHNRNLRSIEMMDILGNYVAKEFVSALSRCNKTSLQKISIEGDSVHDMDAEMSAKMIDSFGMHQNLRYLNLCLGKTETVLWCTSLAKLLKDPDSKIRELDLSCNDIDDEAAAVLANALCYNNSLKVLNLENNHEINSPGWSSLARYFSCPNCSIEVINLSANGITDQVLAALGALPKLQNINLSDNSEISYHGLQALSTVWSQPDSALVNLYLSSIYLGDEGARIMGSSLAHNTQLQHLDLNNNGGVSSAGWRDFFRSISHLTSGLTCLNLGSTNLQDAVIPTMVEALAAMTSLKLLSLSGNDSITTVGWYAFSTLLFRPNSKLEEIDTSSNTMYINGNINDEVATACANALTNNANLRKLIFGYSAITEVGWSAFNNIVCNKSSIETIYSSNHTLISLHYRYTGIPDELASNLELNQNGNKFDVARQKIIRHYFANGDQNTDAFIEMELEMIPRAISWMCRDDAGLSLLYQLVRSMPSLFESENKDEQGPKRKRVE